MARIFCTSLILIVLPLKLQVMGIDKMSRNWYIPLKIRLLRETVHCYSNFKSKTFKTLLWEIKSFLLIPISKPGLKIHEDDVFGRELSRATYNGRTLHFDRNNPFTPKAPHVNLKIPFVYKTSHFDPDNKFRSRIPHFHKHCKCLQVLVLANKDKNQKQYISPIKLT